MIFNIETIITIISICLISFTQIILILSGKTKTAKQLEKIKQKNINKLSKKRDKAIEKATTINEKIEKEKKEYVSN